MQDKGFSKPPTKFIWHFCNKTNYIIYFCNLKLYLELGLHLTNVHHVLLLDQLSWLKNYINFNTRQRTAAKNDFEKDFFKLMNSAVFHMYISFISLLYVYLFLHIDLFIAGESFSLWLFALMCSYILSMQVKLLSLCLCLFVLMHSLIHSLYLNFYLYIYLFLCIDLFIAGKSFIFMIICFYVLIHSLQVQLLSLWLFVLVYWSIHWFIHYR